MPGSGGGDACAAAATRGLRSAGWPAAASGRQGAGLDFDLVGARGHRIGDVPAVRLPGAGSEFLAVDAQAGVVVDRGAFQVYAFAFGLRGQRDLLLKLSHRRVEREFGERVADGEGRLGRSEEHTSELQSL